jgi:hypothetical protein
MLSTISKCGLVVTAALGLLVVAALPSLAATSNTGHAQRTPSDVALLTSASDSQDHIDAKDLDSAGQYRGYPDWARAALAPKS